jgi:hypothetical protein
MIAISALQVGLHHLQSLPEGSTRRPGGLLPAPEEAFRGRDGDPLHN